MSTHDVAGRMRGRDDRTAAVTPRSSRRISRGLAKSGSREPYDEDR